MIHFKVATDLDAIHGLDANGLQQPEQPRRQEVARDRESGNVIDDWHGPLRVEKELFAWGLTSVRGQLKALILLFICRLLSSYIKWWCI
jgi:hypothetical protein